MTYFTLLTRTHLKEPWGIEFGDFDREVVKDEARDLRYGDETIMTKIIRTKEDQASIDKAVDHLNLHI